MFGGLFNDLSVVKTSPTDGSVTDISRVPIAYGPKQKFLARIDQQPDLTEAKIAIKLPRMSFEMTGLVYDAATKINRANVISVPSSTESSRDSVRVPVPYKLGMQLSVMAKTEDDALQIIEQILPIFQPEYTVTVRDVAPLNLKDDIPILLTDVQMLENYEGDFVSRKSIVYVLDFVLKVKFYGPVRTSSVIKKTLIDFIDSNSGNMLERVEETVDPISAEESEAHAILQRISFFTDTTSFLLTVPTGQVPYQVGETVLGSLSGTSGTVAVITANSVRVTGSDGPFRVGDVLHGAVSQAHRVVSAVAPLIDT